jgi:hypothetical protein
MKMKQLIELETNPNNYIGFRLAINPKTIESFVNDNNIDLRAFVVLVRKSSETQLKSIKNIIVGKTDIYTKNNFIDKIKK